MKLAALVILIGASSAPAVFGGPAGESTLVERNDALKPVLIELFTSEGCSSCPPADRLLSRLVSEQPVPGVEVIALGEHVDYWDRLGWPDRFSSADFTRRQRDYRARAFPSSTVYTPQIVVDGILERIGSRENAVLRAIEQAAELPKAALSVATGPVAAGVAVTTVKVEIGAAIERAGPADIMLSVVEDALSTEVARGENRGRRLTHSAVVRGLVRVGSIAENQRVLMLTDEVPIEDEWSPDELRVVAFVQERNSRRILGAASSHIAGTTGRR